MNEQLGQHENIGKYTYWQCKDKSEINWFFFLPPQYLFVISTKIRWGNLFRSTGIYDLPVECRSFPGQPPHSTITTLCWGRGALPSLSSSYIKWLQLQIHVGRFSFLQHCSDLYQGMQVIYIPLQQNLLVLPDISKRSEGFGSLSLWLSSLSHMLSPTPQSLFKKKDHKNLFQHCHGKNIFNTQGSMANL